jgi:hypothetical protein
MLIRRPVRSARQTVGALPFPYDLRRFPMLAARFGLPLLPAELNLTMRMPR